MGRKSGWLGGGALALLLFGTGSSLFGKVIYELKGPDRKGKPKFFAKPWASTCEPGGGVCLSRICLIFYAELPVHRAQSTANKRGLPSPTAHYPTSAGAMFIGMMLCLPGLELLNWVRRQLAKRRRSGDESEALLGSAASDTSTTAEESDEDVAELPAAATAVDKPPATGAAKAKKYALILIPTTFDLIATILMSVGLLFITVSVYQMMRGAEVVFTAVLSVTFLGRQLNRHHIGGICVCTVRGGADSSHRGKPRLQQYSVSLVGCMLLLCSPSAVQCSPQSFPFYVPCARTPCDRELPVHRKSARELVWVIAHAKPLNCLLLSGGYCAGRDGQRGIRRRRHREASQLTADDHGHAARCGE